MRVIQSSVVVWTRMKRVGIQFVPLVEVRDCLSLTNLACILSSFVPADQKAKAQARAYYQEAQKLFDAGKYQEAFQKINLAISKDSSDQNFKKMRSRISPHLKTKVYTRDANYSDRYQEVVELISSNRYEMALGIITDLWKNPANRTENLEKLKNRVERAVGR